MTRNLRIPLWTAYAVGTLVTCFVTMILADLGLDVAVLPALAAFVGVQEGGFAGGMFGLAVGVFGWLTGQGAECIFCCAAAGVLCGGWEGRHLRRFGWPCLISAGVALLGSELVKVVLWLLFESAKARTLLIVAGRELLWSMLVAALMCPLFLFIHRRLGRM